MTPWFKLICNTFLFKWWNQIETIETTEQDDTIHRLGF
jgi:isopentenyl-diphosphate delta-isomerase